jgi:hypothetical protein
VDPREDELREIEAAALAIEECGMELPDLHCRVVLESGGFVSMTPEVARRLVAAIRNRPADPTEPK